MRKLRRPDDAAMGVERRLDALGRQIPQADRAIFDSHRHGVARGIERHRPDRPGIGAEHGDRLGVGNGRDGACRDRLASNIPPSNPTARKPPPMAAAIQRLRTRPLLASSWQTAGTSSDDVFSSAH